MNLVIPRVNRPGGAREYLWKYNIIHEKIPLQAGWIL